MPTKAYIKPYKITMKCVFALLLFISQALAAYRTGAGIYDITGPATEVIFMG